MHSHHLFATAFVFALLPLACGGTFEKARIAGLQTAPPKVKAAAERSPDLETYCRALDDKRIGAGAAAKGAAVVAGISGSGAGVVAAVDERGVPRGVVIGAGVVAVGAAAVGAYEFVKAEGYGEAWARDCR